MSRSLADRVESGLSEMKSGLINRIDGLESLRRNTDRAAYDNARLGLILYMEGWDDWTRRAYIALDNHVAKSPREYKKKAGLMQELLEAHQSMAVLIPRYS